MAKREPRDWEELERDLHAAGVPAAEVESGARKMLALARGTQLADARKEMGVTQREIAAELGVSIARISQIEHGEATSLDVIARYVEALGGRLDLVADFGDRRVRLPVTGAGNAALPPNAAYGTLANGPMQALAAHDDFPETDRLSWPGR